ncbi:hypothetical protein NA57DRAFT_76615 [Rhizodiscina lignyota]|uniref:Uncharacterized protein n=1 Tax=Rhizodiscina lignyota TaxID=1504668 RepID=A0A9P4IEE8_9PEZI|nr:hypothetical protein NA57DRAFT_76615 [Rhizodiscina lignyota]
MQFSTVFIATILAATSTIAAPTKNNAEEVHQLGKRVAANTQSCSARDNGVSSAEYTVTIGEPFANGVGCGSLNNAILEAGVPISDFTCAPGGPGADNTVVTFTNQQGQSKQINTAFGTFYPMVNGGFNCPDF